MRCVFMLRSVCRSSWAEASQALPPKLVAVGLGIALAACSADVTRFSGPTYSLTGSTNRLSSGPIPPASVYGNGGSRLADSEPYGGGGYGGSSYDRYAGGSSAYDYGRGYDSRSTPSQSHVGGYAGSSHGNYNTSNGYNTTVPSSSQHAGNSYVPPARSKLPWDDNYQQPQRDERRQYAALTPNTTDDAYRPSSPAGSSSSYVPPVRPSSTHVKSEPAGASNDDPYLIEVQPGDTLIGIADRYNVSISELMTINALNSPVLKPGKKLRLPKNANIAAARRRSIPANEQKQVASLGTDSYSESTPSQPLTRSPSSDVAYDEEPVVEAASGAGEDEGDYETYTMRPGDNLYGISVRYRVPLAELQRINNITDVRRIRAGTVLKIPRSKSKPVVAQSPEPAANAHEEPAPATTVAEAPAPQARSSDPAAPVIINARKEERVARATEQVMTDVPPGAPLSNPEMNVDAAASEADNTSAEQQADGVGKFRWPVKGRVIAGFGKQPDGSFNDGIKFAVPYGAEVRAAESGVVVYAGDELKDYGNLILIRHDGGWTTAYAHNSELKVARGDRVQRGQIIAKAGNSGKAETPQLHFEVRKGATAVDPIPHLEKL